MLTLLDLWLLSERFKIPIVFFSATTFKENDLSILVNFSSEEYYFIKVPAITIDAIPQFRLVFSPSQGSKITIMDLNSSSLQDEIRTNIKPDYLFTFISTFKYIPEKERKEKKKKKKKWNIKS